MYIKPLSYAQWIMENDENLTSLSQHTSTICVIPYFKFIKYFCEPCLAGFLSKTVKEWTLKFSETIYFLIELSDFNFCEQNASPVAWSKAL